jgi:hypothetical protein
MNWCAAYVTAACSFPDLTVEQLRSDIVLDTALVNARTIAAASTGGAEKVLDENIVRAFVGAQGVEIAPVAAVLGGIIGPSHCLTAALFRSVL